MNFLELCQELIEETGLAGGDSTEFETVVGQTGDEGKAVRYIRNACTYVDNLWKDWKYLWVAISEIDGLPATASEVTGPVGYRIRQWDRSSVWLDRGSANPRQLKYEDWTAFRERTAFALQSGQPSIFSVTPNNHLRFNAAADQAYDFYAEGWRAPVVLRLDDDEPLMPEEFHRIIVERAKIMYADDEDAPEVLEGAEAAYTDLLDKLESDQLASREMERMSTSDVDVGLQVPGFEAGGNLGTSR